MERWTMRNENGLGIIRDPAHTRVIKAIDRLAAYEDTGLEPEQAAALKAYTERKAVMMVTEIDGMPIDRVRELVAAEQEGRLVVLPCKVGTRVYITGHRFPAQIEEVVINASDGITVNWAEYDRGPEETELWDDGWFTPDDFGKTVFLTREEAEKAMEGQK